MRRYGFALLILYSLGLTFGEFYWSQETVRPFFADITGPVRLFAVNTTISAFLLWSCALVFALCLHVVPRQEGDGRRRFFWLSQVVLFAFLGFDDRFQVHEPLGSLLRIDDSLILLAIGFAEIFVLLRWARILDASRSVQVPLFVGGALFAVMTVVDGTFPLDLPGRLSLEDLAKVWACVFFLLFSVRVFREQLGWSGKRPAKFVYDTKPPGPEIPRSS